MRSTFSSAFVAFSPLSLALTLGVAGALAAWAPHAEAQTPAAPAAALIQPGDSRLSCDALAAEIDDLSVSREQAAHRAAGARRMFGFASNALGSGLGWGGGWGAGVASAAAGAAADAAAENEARSAADGAGVQGRRLERLIALHDVKGC